MSMDDKVFEVLNKQINMEFYSAYLYVTYADYYEKRGLKGFANWYMVQSREELDHALALRRYLIDNDCTPTMTRIAASSEAFSSDLGPAESGLRHEEQVTSLIHQCYEVASSVHDIRAMQMLDWFVREQAEEETNARDMITNIKNFGTDCKGIFDLDRENAARVYVPLTALPL